ncbi:MAG: endonuclease mitochondrial [Pseudomonadota bacterium]|jgi:endonuclease G|nr:endonuclease mitochondrial [Pseudomonadota bacterium]
MNKILSFWVAVFRTIERYPRVVMPVITLVLCGYGYEVLIARPALLYQGAPQAITTLNVNTWFRVFRNNGFIVGYSDWRGNPLWVEYSLAPVDENMPHLKRPSHFQTDWRSVNRVDHEDYTKSGYDRGHNAPNHAISMLYGRYGQADSFLMTNVSPQKAKLNQQVWQRLEEIELASFAKIFGKVWVITGPIFSENPERLSSSWRVAIPRAFYKIYVTEETDSKPAFALAFVVPQTVTGKEPLSSFITTIDAIEVQTGLDFLADFDDKIEAHLEGVVEVAPWNMNAVGKVPARVP